MKNDFISKLLYFIHIPIVVVWFGLFFVPSSIWQDKIVYHFWYIVVIFVVQVISGLVLYQRYDLVCPLTTVMQWFRGYKIKSKKNVEHSFTSELASRAGITLSNNIVDLLIYISVVVVSIQYYLR